MRHPPRRRQPVRDRPRRASASSWADCRDATIWGVPGRLRLRRLRRPGTRRFRAIGAALWRVRCRPPHCPPCAATPACWPSRRRVGSAGTWRSPLAPHCDRRATPETRLVSLSPSPARLRATSPNPLAGLPLRHPPRWPSPSRHPKRRSPRALRATPPGRSTGWHPTALRYAWPSPTCAESRACVGSPAAASTCCRRRP